MLSKLAGNYSCKYFLNVERCRKNSIYTFRGVKSKGLLYGSFDGVDMGISWVITNTKWKTIWSSFFGKYIHPLFFFTPSIVVEPVSHGP